MPSLALPPASVFAQPSAFPFAGSSSPSLAASSAPSPAFGMPNSSPSLSFAPSSPIAFSATPSTAVAPVPPPPMSLAEPEQSIATVQLTGRCSGKVQVHDTQESLAIRSEFHFATGQCSISFVSGPDDNRSNASCELLGLSASQEWWPWVQCLGDVEMDLTRVSIFAPFPPEVSPHVRVIMRKLRRRRRWRDHAADIARALARKYPTQQSLDDLNSMAGQFSTEVECLLYSLKNRSNAAKAALLRTVLIIRSDFGFTVKTVLNAIDRYSLNGSDNVDSVANFIFDRADLHGADSESEDDEEEIIVPQSRVLDSISCPIPTDPLQTTQFRPQAKGGPAAVPHSGEFRRVTTRPPVRVSLAGVVHPRSITHYCNSEDGDDGLACLHMAANGSVLHQNHWSCCGMLDESNLVCGQVTEDLFSIDPIAEVPASSVASPPAAAASSAEDVKKSILKIISDRLRRRRRFRSQCQELASSIQSASNPPFTVESAVAIDKSKLYELAEMNLWVLTHPQHRERRNWLPQLFSTLSDFGIPNALHLACKAANVQPNHEHAVAWAMDHMEDGELYHDSASEDCPDSSSGAYVAAAAAGDDELEEFKFDCDMVKSLLPSVCSGDILHVSVTEPSSTNSSSSTQQKQSSISSLLRLGCKADLTLAQALRSSRTASCFHAGFIVSKLLTSSSAAQLSAFVASEKGRLMCDFLIKQVAMESETGGSGRSEMLGTLSALFNRADSRTIFSSRILGFLTSSDSSMCLHALSYLSKCTSRNDDISLRLVSDGNIIAALCKLLRLRISDVNVVGSILRTLSFVLGSVDAIDIDTWSPLFECFGASQPGSFVDKLGIMAPANSALKSVAGDIIVSFLCKQGGYQLISAPFFDTVFGCKSTESSYSPLFCTLWLLKLHQRVSRLGPKSDVPVVTGGCCGRILAAMCTAARRTFQDSTLEQEFQSPLPFSCGLWVAPLAGNASMQPNSYKVNRDFKGSIAPIVLPSWDSLQAAMHFFNLPKSIPTHSLVCVRAEAATSVDVLSKSLFTTVSSVIDSLENLTFDSFVAALGSVGHYSVACVEIRISMGISKDCSNEPLRPEELVLLRTVFGICGVVAGDLVKSLSFDDVTGKLVPEAPVMDFTGMMHALQDCFSIFPKHLRQSFSNACVIATIKQNLESPEVTVSRYLARRSRSTALDIDGMSVFAQLMDYFTSHGFSAFCLTTRGDIMPFRVKFKGEDGQDATQGRGGLFRECLSAVAEELSSCAVPVFLHRGRDEEFEVDPLVLSPLCASTSRGRSCLMFLGVLMGVAMRSGEPLALDIHSSVWHALVGGTVTHPIDSKTADMLVSNKFISSVYASACDGHYDRDFEYFFELPALLGADSLVPVDNSMTCEEYQQALLRFASQEIAVAVKCVRQGLLKVVPAASLFTLSWQQLRANVCGSPSFTFDDLEPFLITQQGAAISDAAFAILKNVLRSYTPQQLSLFLRFCTGLLRLPTDSKSRKGFNINIRRVIASSARPGRPAPANPDG